MEIGIRDVAFLAVVVVMFVIFISWMLWFFLHYSRETFEKVFGFKPPFLNDGPEGIQLLQPDVDYKLERLASNFRDADLAERCAAKNKYGSPEERLERLRRMRELTQTAKARFWRAHGLAASFLFTVKPKYTDYLVHRYPKE